MTNGNGDRPREREQRDLELLKHVSTLNVATLVLLAALVRDFSPATAAARAPRWILLAFGLSLLIAVAGLALTLVGRSGTDEVRVLIAVAYGIFLVGLIAALLVAVGFVG